ncbi:unnamed protein product, partial [Durusdinium trenchii]
PFHITEDMAVLFAYHVNGSGAVLELQYMTATANWTSLFSVLSHQDIFWQQAAVSIPSTSTALRFLARTSGSQDVILIDSLSCSNAVSSIENLSCSFEEDFCGWASSWLRYSDPMSWYDLGRQDAFHGDWYIHVDSSRQDLALVSPWLGGLGNARDRLDLHFFYYMFFPYGASRLNLECRHDNWTWSTLWSKQGSQGAVWRFGMTTLPATASALRFVVDQPPYYGHIALDAIGVGVPTVAVDFKGLACDFEFEGCFWLFDHQFNESTWRYVSTAMSSVPANDGSWYLQAAGNGFDNE